MKTRLAMLMAAALLMWCMKRYYSEAPVDGLRWILGPTSQLVTALTGVPFERQPGEGYLSRERFFLIEKACAGINFMIAAFGMVAWVLGRRAASCLSAGCVLAVSALASYAAAVLVNALRIATAIWLAANDVATPWMTATEIHRIEGTAVYFGGLVLLYELVRRFDGRLQLVRKTA